jgi:hypothetical protein
MLESKRTPLTVVRVEPALVCRTPDGDEIIVFAHAVEIADA